MEISVLFQFLLYLMIRLPALLSYLKLNILSFEYVSIAYHPENVSCPTRPQVPVRERNPDLSLGCAWAFRRSGIGRGRQTGRRVSQRVKVTPAANTQYRITHFDFSICGCLEIQASDAAPVFRSGSSTGVIRTEKSKSPDDSRRFGKINRTAFKYGPN